MSKKKKDISEAVTLESMDENIVVADTEAEGEPSVSEEKEEKKKKHKEKNGDRKRKRRKRRKKKERKKLGKKGWMIIGGVMYYGSNCKKNRSYLVFTIKPDGYDYEVVEF